MRISEWLPFLTGLVLSAIVLPVSAATDGKSGLIPFTAAEQAQGYTNRAVLALPRIADANSREASSEEKRENLKVVRVFPRFDGIRVIEVPDGVNVDTFIARLRATGRYATVERDRIITKDGLASDPDFASGKQWSLRNTGQDFGKAGADIHATEAWDVITDASTVLVAVIDSGANLQHADLIDNLWRNPGESGGGKENNGIDDDNNGYIDDVFGINASVPKTQAAGGDPTDDDGHGTAVAGVIGAVGNNGLGVTGVAWRARIMPLKFLTADGTGATSDGIECMDYAVARGAKIINASFGSSTFSAVESAAMQRIKNAGIILVAAAGNDGLNNDEIGHYPGNYPFDNIVAVGASTRTDTVASFSNFGSGKVDLFAPGLDILGLTRNPPFTNALNSGTSFSAPHVTGALALIKAKYPADTPRESINRLLRGVDHIPAFIGKAQSSGRLNVARALSAESRPFNDDFAERGLLAGRFVSVRTTNNGATRETGETAHAGSTPAHSLWWDWTATEAATIRVDTRGSLVDTVLSIYTGSRLGEFVEVVSNDNEVSDRSTSAVSFTAVVGQTYHIAVDGRFGQEGMILLNLRTPPANDSFAAARLVTGPSFRVTQTNIGGTRQLGEPRIANHSGGQSVWFRWVAPSTGRVQASVFSDAVDTLLGVYKGPALATLTLVGDNDDPVEFLPDASVAFETVAGETYYFAVDSFTEGGVFDFTVVDSEWQFFVEGPIDAPPAAATDGTIYYSGGYGELGAVSPAGTQKWLFEMAEFSSYSSPAVASDGTIYVGDVFGDFYAVDPNGKSKWSLDTGGFLYASPAISNDGTIYVRSEDSPLRALTPEKVTKWTTSIAGESYTSPTVSADGTVYLGSTDHRMRAFYPDKSLRWSFDAGDEIFASPALSYDGTLYFGTIGARFLAVKPDGTLLWSFVTGGGISSSAAIGPDGALYFGAYDGKLYALNANGSLRWATQVGTDIRTSSPVVDDQGVVYIGTLDGDLIAVDADGQIRRTYHFARPIRSSPLLVGGLLYVGCQDYRLYAIRTNTTPAASPWPMFRRNAARTGSMEIRPLALATQPSPQRLLAGGTVSLSVSVTGAPPFTYQWRKDGVDLAGATGPSLILANAQVSQTGIYTVLVKSGVATVTSYGATVIIESALAPVGNAARLTNLSVRSLAGTAEKTLIVGFSVAGGPKTLLVRGIGPTLADYGVPGVVPDPRIELIGNGLTLDRNDNWKADQAAVFASVGAFQLTANSKDAALIAPVLPSGYSAKVDTDQSGVALVELYDLDRPVAENGPRLINVSARSQVGTGGDVLIAGFVISGEGNRRILIRAIGPQLGEYGVPNILLDPVLELYRGDVVLAENDNWSGDDGRGAGAFPLNLGSKDSVIVRTLPPGNYSAKVTGANNTTGVALIEVYEW